MDPNSNQGQLSGWQQQRANQSRGRIPPPPFVAGAVRISALEHIESYRRHPILKLQPEAKLLPPLEGSSSGGVVSQSLGENEVDEMMEAKIIQALLATDLQRLLEASTYLNANLLRGRDRTWIIHTAIAVSWDLVMGNNYVRRFFRGAFQLFVPDVLRYFAYPIAIYNIVKMERQISSTATTTKDLESLLFYVKNGDVIGDHDIQCLKGRKWSAVPWEKLEEGI